MFESPSDRSAYHAARRLVEIHGQPHDFLTLKSRLQNAPGVVVASVPKSLALDCQEQLAAVGLATQISYQAARPIETAEDQHREKTPPGRSVFRFVRDRPGTAGAMLVGLTLVVAVFVLGRDDGASAPGADIGPIGAEQFAALAEASIVELSCEGNSGAGFFVAEGIVVTAAHIVCPAVPSVEIRFHDNRTTQGRVTRVDNWLDLALVRTTGASGVPLQLAESTGLASGDSVVMAGNSRGEGAILARARVTNSNRSLLGTSFLQIDTAKPTGVAGLPLLDVTGRVVGVVLSRVGSSASLWLVLPSEYLVEGPSAVLPDLEVRIDRERWAARVREAGEAEKTTVAEARSNASRAGVIAARAASPASVVVDVARWSASSPSDQLFSFTIRRGEDVLCSPSATATRWVRAGSGEINIPASRFVMWLERNDMLQDTYVSPVRLDTSDCGDPSAVPGSTLVLHSGAAYADRSTIVSR